MKIILIFFFLLRLEIGCVVLGCGEVVSFSPGQPCLQFPSTDEKVEVFLLSSTVCLITLEYVQVYGST